MADTSLRVANQPSFEGTRRFPAMAALTIALAYYMGAKLGFALTLPPLPVSPLWPPNAILFAGLLLTPARSWLYVLAAVFVAHLAVQFQSGVPTGMVLSWYVSNCTEALIGAGLLRRFAGGMPTFGTVRHTTLFLAYAGFAAPFFSSFIDAAFVVLNGWGESDYWTIWRTRFFSNVLATITIVPVIVTTAEGFTRLRDIPRRKLAEAFVGFIALLGVCWIVFVQQRPAPGTSPALLYTPLPLLVGAAVRFGPWGGSASILMCALLAIWGASLGQGPFITSSAAENARAIQFFLIIVWIPVMSLAAVIRERAYAEAHARASEAQLASAIEAAQLGSWDWDIATGRLAWSDITRRMYEIPADAPVTIETFERLVHPEDRELVDAAVADALAGRGVDMEFRIRFPDGRIKWIFSKGMMVRDADGRPARIVGVKVDITARKSAELQVHEQQRRLAQLSGVSVAGELSIALAHELNQPLAAILANAGAARRFLLHDPPNLNQLREIVEAIAHDDRRAAEVIPRIDALLRKGDAPWERLDINEVIGSVISLARADLISRGVSATQRFTQGLPQVLGDVVQLQQVTLNLIINACDAMEDVTAGARCLHVRTGPDDHDGVRVTISDTGTGVPADRLEHIFEPFVTSKPQRLGLGLSMCRSIIAAHNGRLWVESKPAGGATVFVSLPAAAAAYGSDVGETSIPQRGRTK